jgi:hypothetical protein
MDKKAIAEIRKLMTAGNCRIDRIRGCYVNDNGDILMEMKETFLAMQEENVEKYLELLRKTLTGKPGRSLFNMEFPTEEEMEGGRQEFLYRLQQSQLQDEDLVRTFFDRVVQTYQAPGKYLIILVHGLYDIPARTSDNQELEDASDFVYSFLLCSICPVTELKEGLCYDPDAGMFVDKRGDWAVQKPDLGFLFPAYNDRMPDIHSLLYYTRKEEERHPEFTDEILGAALPMPESDQKNVFRSIVEQTLGRDCDFENVKGVTESINRLIEESKDDPEPVRIEKADMRRILTDNGASREIMDDFDEAFDEAVGPGKALTAENVRTSSTLEVKSPSMKISVKGDMTDMIRTRVIDGMEYLIIPVVDEIEVNGIRILRSRREE